MRRVPVRKRRRRQHLLPGALGETLVSLDAIRKGEHIDPRENQAALPQEPRPHQLVFRRGLVEQVFRLFSKLAHPPLSVRVASGHIPHAGEVLLEGNQARVIQPQSLEAFFVLISGDGRLPGRGQRCGKHEERRDDRRDDSGVWQNWPPLRACCCRC